MKYVYTYAHILTKTNNFEQYFSEAPRGVVLASAECFLAQITFVKLNAGKSRYVIEGTK